MSVGKEREGRPAASLGRGARTAGTLIIMALELLLITAMLNGDVSAFIYQGF